jgi:L-amino acid N-acyltransferase YncA
MDTKRAGLMRAWKGWRQGRDGARFRSRRGRAVAIRRAHPDDLIAIAAMIGGLSRQTAERRYLVPRALSAEAARSEAARLTMGHADMIVLVAHAEGEAAGIVAVAELVRDRAEPAVAEGAVVVSDAYQGEGIGRAVAERLAEVAERAAIRRVRATVHAYNTPVRRLIASFGRPYTAQFSGAEVQYEVAL